MFTRRIPATAAALIFALSACGGNGSSPPEPGGTDSAATPDVQPPVSDAAADDSDGADESESSPAGSGQATLTVADGTVYEFEMTSCDTSNNVDIFMVDPGYDLSGTTEDGFRFGLIRAAFEEPTNALGDLEGRYDENGVNPEISYVFREPDSVITLDGDTLTGDLVLSGFASEDKVHGEDTTATLSVTC